MHPLRLLSAVEQVAAHLRSEVQRGQWSGTMPGADWVAAELGANRGTVEAALCQLEKEGLLLGQGRGRKRLIVPQSATTAHPLRVGILLHDRRHDQQLGYFAELEHALQAAGHASFFAEKGQTDFKFDVRRISRFVEQTPADAWVVVSGSSELLTWFAAQPVPALALFGRPSRVSIASSRLEKVPAYVEATRQLVALGHRRIVLLCRKMRRLPQPGRVERAFLEELAAQGCRVSAFNLPDWEETVPGFHHLLGELFRTTPPTALIIDEPMFYIAALQFLGQRRLLVPQQVSLVCSDHDPSFDWCQPAVSHMHWATGPVIRRVVRWAANVSRGEDDRKQTLTPAEFVPGGTIGPVGKG